MKIQLMEVYNATNALRDVFPASVNILTVPNVDQIDIIFLHVTVQKDTMKIQLIEVCNATYALRDVSPASVNIRIVPNVD